MFKNKLFYNVKTLVTKWVNRRKYKLNDLSSWLVSIVGSLSFIVAGYFGFIVSTVSPDYLKIFNTSKEISVDSLLIGFILVLLSIGIWFYGAIAKKCNDILRIRFDI